jgi:hypothetical protein
MSAFNNYTREQLRLAYAQAWAKHQARSPLTPLEALITDVISLHPEYQSLVADGGTAVAFEQNTAAVNENPFLHMGLHLAVREQLSIDRPPGIRAVQRRLLPRYSDAHDVEHVLMEALGEELWSAQRDGRSPDEKRYLVRVQQKVNEAS